MRGEVYATIEELNPKIVARDFQRCIINALDREAVNTDYMYKLVAITVLAGAFTWVFFTGHWFTDQLQEQPTALWHQW